VDIIILRIFIATVLSSAQRSGHEDKNIKTVILPVLIGCKTWSQEHTLRVFENRVLRGVFGPKREEVAGGWRRLHNEELHNLYVSQNIIKVIKSRRMRWAGHVACMGEMRNTYNILVGKREGKRSLARPGSRRESNVRMYIREIPPFLQYAFMAWSIVKHRDDFTFKSRDSSVGIALGYGLDDRGSRVQLSAGAGNFSLHHHVQHGPGAHPTSYPMGTRGSFRGGKAAGT
jgi:hypothetical protein